MNTGNNLIYLIASAFLGLMGVSGFFGKRNIQAVEIEVGVPDEIYAHTGFPLKIVLRNRRRFMPAFLIEVRVDGEKALFPFTEAGGEAARLLDITAAHRGRHTVGEIHIGSVFPFNFFRRFRKVPVSVEFIVFPEARKCAFLSDGGRKRGAGGERSSAAGFEGEVVSFRKYAQGDPMKYICWKGTARTGELKTKELSSPALQPVVIEYDRLPAKNTEERLSCAAYLILEMFRRGAPVGLRIEGKLFKAGVLPAHKLRMLRELALYGGE